MRLLKIAVFCRRIRRAQHAAENAFHLLAAAYHHHTNPEMSNSIANHAPRSWVDRVASSQPQRLLVLRRLLKMQRKLHINRHDSLESRRRRQQGNSSSFVDIADVRAFLHRKDDVDNNSGVVVGRTRSDESIQVKLKKKNTEGASASNGTKVAVSASASSG